MLAAGHSILPLSFRSLFLSSFFRRHNLRGLADRHQTLPHVRWWPRFIKFGQKFGWPFSRNLAAPKHQNLGSISYNFGTWSRISPENNNISPIWKRRCNLRTPPHNPNLIQCTWVHKRWKIGTEFWPTQRAAITTHQVYLHVFTILIVAFDSLPVSTKFDIKGMTGPAKRFKTVNCCTKLIRIHLIHDLKTMYNITEVFYTQTQVT